MSTWEQRQAARLAYERDVENARKDSSSHAPALGSLSSNAQQEKKLAESGINHAEAVEYSSSIQEHGHVNAQDARLTAKQNYEEKLRLALSPARPAPVEVAGIPLAVVAASPSIVPGRQLSRGVDDLIARQPKDEFLARNTPGKPQQLPEVQNRALVSSENNWRVQQNRVIETSRYQAGESMGNAELQSSGRLRKDDVGVEFPALIRPQYSSSTLTPRNTGVDLNQKSAANHQLNPQQQSLHRDQQQKVSILENSAQTPSGEAVSRQRKNLRVQLFANEDEGLKIKKDQRPGGIVQESKKQLIIEGQVQGPSRDQPRRQPFVEQKAQFKEMQVENEAYRAVSAFHGSAANENFQGKPIPTKKAPLLSGIMHGSNAEESLLATAGRVPLEQQAALQVYEESASSSVAGVAFKTTTEKLKNEIEGLKREVSILRTQKTSAEQHSPSRYSSLQQFPQRATSLQSATTNALLLCECSNEVWHISSIQTLDRFDSAVSSNSWIEKSYFSLSSGQGSRPKSAHLLTEARDMLESALSGSSTPVESKQTLPFVSSNGHSYTPEHKFKGVVVTAPPELAGHREVDELISASKFVPYL
jgi:hypothetical protein